MQLALFVGFWIYWCGQCSKLGTKNIMYRINYAYLSHRNVLEKVSEVSLKESV